MIGCLEFTRYNSVPSRLYVHLDDDCQQQFRTSYQSLISNHLTCTFHFYSKISVNFKQFLSLKIDQIIKIIYHMLKIVCFVFNKILSISYIFTSISTVRLFLLYKLTSFFKCVVCLCVCVFSKSLLEITVFVNVKMIEEKCI